MTDSVKQIMMARIDRLSGLVKETVKAAAVIGREFELPVLSAVMARQEEFIRKNGDLELVLQRTDPNRRKVADLARHERVALYFPPLAAARSRLRYAVAHPPARVAPTHCRSHRTTVSRIRKSGLSTSLSTTNKRKTSRKPINIWKKPPVMRSAIS
ncbi:MAG: hypothetical protein V9F82_07645 [Dermatophilaceae bacterium]